MLRPFLFYRFYLHVLSLSNVGDFYWSEIRKDFFQVQKEGKENSSSYLHVLHKMSVSKFHVILVQWTSKKYQKARCTCKVVVSLIKPIVDVVVVVESWSKRNTNTVISMAGCFYAAFQSTS